MYVMLAAVGEASDCKRCLRVVQGSEHACWVCSGLTTTPALGPVCVQRSVPIDQLVCVQQSTLFAHCVAIAALL